MTAPPTGPLGSMSSRVNLPKRELLWLLVVHALQKASKTTLDCSTQRESSLSCTSSSSLEILRESEARRGEASCPARQHRYCMMCLFASVLPAPDTPDTTMAWLPSPRDRLRYAPSATA